MVMIMTLRFSHFLSVRDVEAELIAIVQHTQRFPEQIKPNSILLKLIQIFVENSRKKYYNMI